MTNKIIYPVGWKSPAQIANAPILAELAANDLKTIRALREGDTARIQALEAQQIALRAKLVQE